MLSQHIVLTFDPEDKAFSGKKIVLYGKADLSAFVYIKQVASVSIIDATRTSGPKNW